MAKETNRARLSLLLIVLSACAQGVDAVDPGPPLASAGTGDAAGIVGAQAGSDSATAAGSGGTGAAGAGSASAGAHSAGSSASGGSAGAAGSSKGGSASGGSATGGNSGAAGSSSAGSSAGGTSSAGAAGSSSSGASSSGASSGGASAGSAGTAGSGGTSAAPCSGKKPEANCTCQTYSAHDYWFCPTGHDFTTSEANCVSAGLHLAHVTSSAEDKWINDAANAASFGEYWLGSTDASTPNTWTWLAGGTFWTGVANGTASGYAHWNTGEPNASGDCLVVQTGFAWDDRICTDQRKYICD